MADALTVEAYNPKNFPVVLLKKFVASNLWLLADKILIQVKLSFTLPY